MLRQAATTTGLHTFSVLLSCRWGHLVHAAWSLSSVLGDLLVEFHCYCVFLFLDQRLGLSRRVCRSLDVRSSNLPRMTLSLHAFRGSNDVARGQTIFMVVVSMMVPTILLVIVTLALGSSLCLMLPPLGIWEHRRRCCRMQMDDV